MKISRIFYLISILIVFICFPTALLGADICVKWQDVNMNIIIDYTNNMSSSQATLARNFAVGVLEDLSKQGRLTRAGGIGFPCKYSGSYVWDYKVSSGNRKLVLNAIKSTSSGGWYICGYYKGNGLMTSIKEGAKHIKNLSVPGKKILIVITKGEDSHNWYSMSSYNQAIQDAAYELKNSTASNYLVYFPPSYSSISASELGKIAQASGSKLIQASLSNAKKIVNEILANACKNHRPNASMSISNSNLHLGVDKPPFSITFDGSSSSDKDPSDTKKLKFLWTLHPPGNQPTFTRTSIKFTETFKDSWLKYGETWKVELKVTDPSGSSDKTSTTFKVTGSKPSIKLSGPDIDALDKLTLSASPTKDVDGGDLEFQWRVVSSPPKAQYKANHIWTYNKKNHTISFVTKEGDIGNWTFECIARDNEKQTDKKQIPNVEVRNKPPKIKLEGKAEIDIGDTIKVETKILKDEDGGDLEFTWDILQAPKDATPNVTKEYIKNQKGIIGSFITIPTAKDVKYAGTWIVRLTAKDNDNASNSVSKPKEFAVVVDAPPKAVIKGMKKISTKDFPFDLNGGDSLDPDSPPASVPQRGHKRLDGKPPDKISAGIVSYLWSIVDFLPIYQSHQIPMGRVDDVLNVPATGKKLSFKYADLKPGDWTFQLQVKDKEKNTDSTTHAVTVIEANSPPVAVLNPPARYTISAAGLLKPIILSGKNSYDLDELLKPGVSPFTPGMGIDNYAWKINSLPDGCIAPVLPSGKDKHTVTLYKKGAMVSAACQGHWSIGLTVTDNDSPAKKNSAHTNVIIGNCPQPLCIDYPTKAKPHMVEFAENTNVLVYYHLDSALYGASSLKFGLITRMAIYHQSDLSTPVYTSPDANVLPSNKGGMLVFYWDGYTNAGQRPKEGKYTVKIALLDHLLKTTSYWTSESDAIWIKVAEPSILPTSDKYVSFDKLDKGKDKVSLSYKIKGSAKPDEVRWRVIDSSTKLKIYESKLPVGLVGTINWDGQVAGKTIPTGDYTVVLEAYKTGAILGKSDPHQFTVYKISIEPVTGIVPGTPPTQIVQLNGDDDNSDGKIDKDEIGPISGENDLVETKVKIEPGLPSAKFSLTAISGANTIKLWDKPGKQKEIALNTDQALAANTVAYTFYVEGLEVGKAKLAWVLKNTSGSEMDRAEIDVTVTKVDIDVNGDHTGDIGQYLPGYNLSNTPQGTTTSLLQDLDIVLVGAANLSNLTVELSAANTSSHKGFAGNGPTTGVFAAGQTDFVLRKNNVDGTSFGGLSTDANGIIQGLKLRCRDYAGKTKVIIKLAKSPPFELFVPQDRDKDGLADVYEKKQLQQWRDQYGLGVGFNVSNLSFFDHNSNKEQKDPDGTSGIWVSQKTEGDPTNAFVEYRGFMLSGGGFDESRKNGHPGGHKRLSFARKELLVEVDLRNALTPPRREYH